MTSDRFVRLPRGLRLVPTEPRPDLLDRVVERPVVEVLRPSDYKASGDDPEAA